ncbi:aldo/keto reductase [Simiduia agarivorans]|uniref:NADP-dependent oxidoreductase domain-containing protein n=1 Tax=Simiduia agarivorans (strain DSM 21679 / JCM 13881 / BCRC 17597 / SA1) TaxID=1117647 RepID=K4KLW5_SIMAS|nr:aldo/keto reductase [Simiduia agarivorans]AFU99073.1 hypothetical protein M5M_09440 [Simiduia agarivorans SA1 = DSM 21679]
MTHAVSLAPDLTFSRLIYGWWRLMSWDMDTKAIEQRLEACIAMGITTHDHADIYGDYLCETTFGQALRQRPDLRAQIQLVSKCGIELVSAQRPAHRAKAYNTSRDHIVASAERSLRELGTDYLDVLLIHRPDPLMDVDAIASAFAQLKSAGKVRYFGVSNFLPDQYQLLQSRLDSPLVTNQLEVSVMHHDAFHDGSLNLAQRVRQPVMAWSALAGGRLFSDPSPEAQRVRDALTAVAKDIGAESIDQVALAWLLCHPAQILPIVGSGNLNRIQSAKGALELGLTRDQWYSIWLAGNGTLP